MMVVARRTELDDPLENSAFGRAARYRKLCGAGLSVSGIDRSYGQSRPLAATTGLLPRRPSRTLYMSGVLFSIGLGRHGR
ncbi:hypothetical protein ACVWXM_009671 [Bradyrhizobium sp. GM7.3]